MIRLLLVDDHHMLLDGLKSLIDGVNDMSVVATASNGQEAIDRVLELDVDVVLLDIQMPVMDGLKACSGIIAQKPGARVIAMSMYGEGRLVKAMLGKGASGYLLKNCHIDELLEAVRAVHAGGTWLSKEASTKLVDSIQRPGGRLPPSIDPPSERELDVLRAIAAERTTDEIAKELGISVNTVESHRRQLLQKLGVRNSAGLVRVAMQQGLLDP